jgi:flagellar basal body-associated protein FliL
MSQEKIDAYKKEKSGRKEAIAKHKKRVKIAKITSIVVAVAIVAAIVGSILWNNFGGSNSVAAESAATEVSVETESTEAVSVEEAASEASSN